jgi:hypothetical protein
VTKPAVERLEARSATLGVAHLISTDLFLASKLNRRMGRKRKSDEIVQKSFKPEKIEPVKMSPSKKRPKRPHPSDSDDSDDDDQVSNL